MQSINRKGEIKFMGDSDIMSQNSRKCEWYISFKGKLDVHNLRFDTWTHVAKW